MLPSHALPAVIAIGVLVTSSATLLGQLPGPDIPSGLGVNIHFTDARPGEMKMLADGGFALVRMDFAWSGIERQKGQYDFAAYDRLLDALQQHHIRALFILDYGNPLYEAQFSASTEASRDGFARWAAAAVKRYAGRGILWEMWNEPNHSTFWQPKPDVESYCKLALAVGRAIREAAPNEVFIGPATSTIDFAFLEGCFKAGLLEYWSAVSVHPYRQIAPETVVEEYRKLRLLIDQYAPPGKQIPILSGEWGYSAAWDRVDAEGQGKLLARQWLVNLACDVPVSIWYDWHDDGSNPKDGESNFGTVTHTYHEGRDPSYDPKPAYLAAKALTTALSGYRFNKRLALDRPDDWVLLFTKGNDTCLVVWTAASGAGHQVTIPTGAGRFNVTSHLGKALAPLEAGSNGLTVELTDAPQYLVPQSPDEFLGIVAAWTRLRTDRLLHAPATFTPELQVRNVTERPIRLFTSAEQSVQVPPGGSHAGGNGCQVLRTAYPIRMRQPLHIEGFPTAYQESLLVVANPLEVTALPVMGEQLPVRIANVAGEPFRGKLVKLAPAAQKELGRADVTIAEGQTEAMVFMPAGGQGGSYELALRLLDEQGQAVVEIPQRSYQAMPLDAEGYQLHPDGDPKVASEQSATLVDAPQGLPAAGTKAMRIDYRYDAGWKFIRLAVQSEPLQQIQGKPLALGLWVHGDGSGNSPRLRFVDATGQCFQPTVQELTYGGWRYVQFPMDGTQTGYWGGAKDGIVHYPIRLDTLFLLDGVSQKATRGTVYIALPTMIYDR